MFGCKTYLIVADIISSGRDVKLLSFGADEGAEEEEEPVTFKKKPIVRPDCQFILACDVHVLMSCTSDGCYTRPSFFTA